MGRSRAPIPTSAGRALVRETDGCPVAVRLEIARGMLARAMGLLGRRELAPGAAMLIDPCSGIHTIGMQFAIDAVFVDREMRIISIHNSIQPWRLLGPVAGARAVIELPAGASSDCNLDVGQRLRIVAAPRGENNVDLSAIP